MSANHAFHSQTFRRLQKPKCLRESEMGPAEMSVNEELQKPKCLSALRAPPVAERFGASISDSHRHFDRCIFSFADISAESKPRGRAPGGLPGLSCVLPEASPAPPSRSSLGSPGGSPRVTRVSLGLPSFSRAFLAQPRAPGRFPVPPECLPGASSLRRPKSL